MLKQIVKIANKLDSLGLTKEADILDGYLSKIAIRASEITYEEFWQGAREMEGIETPPPITEDDVKRVFSEAAKETCGKINIVGIKWCNVNADERYALEDDIVYGYKINYITEDGEEETNSMWRVPEYYSYSHPVIGTDGETYYLYCEF